MFTSFTLTLSLLLTAPAVTESGPTVQLRLESSDNESAPVRLAVYDSPEAFATEKALSGFIEPLNRGSAKLEVLLPQPGSYVFAAFHDLNDNGKLDRNVFGIPTEPYGFTEIPATKWRAPAFEEVATRVDSGTTALINLRRWGEY